MAEFIEVTLASMVQGGTAGPRASRIVGLSHIATISSGVLGTGAIALATGEKLNVQESYEDLKKLLGTSILRVQAG